MIAYLEGVLREKTPARVVVDVNGVGYELWVPLSTFTELPDESKTVALRVHTHVREDAIQLFGFGTARERALFELLLRTSGIGPKLALSVLSGMETERLFVAISSGDVAALQSVPGVGRKTAERIVLELRERAAELAGASLAQRPAVAAPLAETAEQALSALLHLGYTRGQAQRVLEEAAEESGADAALEVLLRAALRRLAR